MMPTEKRLPDAAVLEPQTRRDSARPSAAGVRLFRRLFETYCRTVLRTYVPLRVEGRERLPSSPFVLCANHNSHMDSVVLMAASGLRFDRFTMVAARDYFFDGDRQKFLPYLLMDLIPVDRRFSRQALARYIDTCREFLVARGKNLIIYPEGTRSTTGELLSFKRGPSIVAVDVGIPIVPAFIEGTHRTWPKGGRFLKPGAICVRFGEAIEPGDFQGPEESNPGRPSKAAIYRRMTQELEGRVHALKEASTDDH